MHPIRSQVAKYKDLGKTYFNWEFKVRRRQDTERWEQNRRNGTNQSCTYIVIIGATRSSYAISIPISEMHPVGNNAHDERREEIEEWEEN